jgi:hypothetical protein
MGTPSPSQLLEALRDWGCDPKPFRSTWATHNRGTDWHPDGITHHHTAGSAKLLTDAATQEAMRRMLWTGRPDLHGPLCHGNVSMIGDTGKARIYLIGYGIANHAGKGSSRTLARVKAGTYDGQAPGPDDTDGNPRFFGLEYSHPGDGKTHWPDALLDCGHRAACAYAEAAGWPRHEWPGRNVEHREWTTRKIDRRWTGDLRAAIKRVSEEKDMATPAENWNTDGLIDNQSSTAATNPKTSPATALEQAWSNARTARENTGDIKSDVAALKTAVARIPTSPVTLTAAQIASIAAQVPTPKVPTASEVAAEVIAQLRAHPLTPKV